MRIAFYTLHRSTDDRGPKNRAKRKWRTAMLINANSLKGFTLDSLDGEIGSVREFYFDDKHWTVRYMVAATGSWLTGRQVLISPYSLNAVNEDERLISVDLTKKQIEDSPSLDTDKPVSRQYEEAFHGFYGYPIYWGGPYTWGAYPLIVHDREGWTEPILDDKKWDPNLRSSKDLGGHRVQATDGEIGHIQDLIIDDATWEIRYLVIDTRNLWPGRVVLVAPHWIKRVSWGESTVFVDLSCESIRLSPEYVEGALPTRDYEAKLHGYYNRKGYWVDEPAVATPARK